MALKEVFNRAVVTRVVLLTPPAASSSSGTKWRTLRAVTDTGRTFSTLRHPSSAATALHDRREKNDVCLLTSSRRFSTPPKERAEEGTLLAREKYKLVIVGGGAGGCSTAAHFCRTLGKGNVAVVDPSEIHAYQSMWTLVGAGLKKLSQSLKPMAAVLPEGCVWIQDAAVTFDPDHNAITTKGGKRVEYDYLVMAAGIQLNYDKVKGLVEALETDPMVVSNYCSKYVTKTYPALQRLSGGHAIFSLPNTPIKCAGAPLKIMYLADEIFRNRGVRNNINISYYTSLPVIFRVQKYAATLMKIVERKHLDVSYRHDLVEVRPHKREAVIQLLDSPQKETYTVKYDFLHATPPQSVPDALVGSGLLNADGWVDVDRDTLQHAKYRNVFGLGDCTSLPTSKTCAAAAAQFGVLAKNLTAFMNGAQLPNKYCGYTSCPLVTGKNKCILAEFDYDGTPMETFPFDQSQERMSMYLTKVHVMPRMYWHGLLKGIYEGPAPFRKILHFGKCG